MFGFFIIRETFWLCSTYSVKPLHSNVAASAQWPNYMDKYVRTGTTAL